MYYPEPTTEQELSPKSGTYLTADELRGMIDLMRELRNVTLSRGTFRATTEFLRRFAGETVDTSVIAPDLLVQ